MLDYPVPVHYLRPNLKSDRLGIKVSGWRRKSHFDSAFVDL